MIRTSDCQRAAVKLGIKPEAFNKYGGRADLHIHSSLQGPPEELVKASHALGLGVISITDNYRISANREAREFSLSHNLLKVLPGIETKPSGELAPMDFIEKHLDKLEIDAGVIEKHKYYRYLDQYDVLGYGYGSNAPGLSALEEKVMSTKKARFLSAIRQVNEWLEADGQAEKKLIVDADKYPSVMSFSRIQLKKILIDNGIMGIANNEDAMASIMKKADKECGEVGLPIKDSVDLILADGGEPFLAHPFLIERVSLLTGTQGIKDEGERWRVTAERFMLYKEFFSEFLRTIVSNFQKMGGRGIEIFHPHHLLLPGAVQLVRDTALDHHMRMCGGSDYSVLADRSFIPWHLGIVPPEKISDETTLSMEQIRPWAGGIGEKYFNDQGTVSVL